MENKSNDDLLSEEDLKEFAEFEEEVNKMEKECNPDRADYFEEERLALKIQQVFDETLKGKRRKIKDEEKYAYKLLIITDMSIKTRFIEECGQQLSELGNKPNSFLTRFEICFAEKAIGKIDSDRSINMPFNLILVNCFLPESEKIELCKKIKTDPKNEHLAILLATDSIDTRRSNAANSYIQNDFTFEELLEELKILTKSTPPGYPIYELLKQ